MLKALKHVETVKTAKIVLTAMRKVKTFNNWVLVLTLFLPRDNIPDCLERGMEGKEGVGQRSER
jgi:hypothetical protein